MTDPLEDRHPLLTKVLAEAKVRCPRPLTVGDMVAAIPPAIADRLEEALDACTFAGCGEQADSIFHEHIPGEDAHEPHDGCHPYQPLVEVTP